MIINTTLDLFKYGTPPKKSELTDKEFQDHIIKSPTKKQHEKAFSMGRALLKVSEAEKNKMANEWMTNSGREKGGRSFDEEIKLGKEEWLKKQKETKLADKKLIKWALEESPVPVVRNPYLKRAIEAQQRVAKKPLPKDWKPKYLDGNVIDLKPLIDDSWWLIKPEEPEDEETRIPKRPKEKFGLAYLLQA